MSKKMSAKKVKALACHCERCGHDWQAKGGGGKKPKSCPACKQYGWETKAHAQGESKGGNK